MGQLRRQIERIGLRRLLWVSLALNVVLVTKIVVFDPSFEFKPMCLSYGGLPLFPGLERVEGAQTEDFRNRMRKSMEALRQSSLLGDYRVSASGRNFVSLYDIWTSDEELWWNYSYKAVKRMIDEVGIKPDLPDTVRQDAKRGLITCAVTHAYAIEITE